VVVIAAGYDTRAYRLSRPGVKFYEIDLPHASKNKQELVRSLLPADKVRLAGSSNCRPTQATAVAALLTWLLKHNSLL
jgi:O-methyltransferase involved in polyketide biosynthesis